MYDINGEKKREIEMCMWVLRVKLKGEGYMHIYICIEKKAGQYLIVLHINIYIVFTYS